MVDAGIGAGTGLLRLESESADLRIIGRLQNRPIDPEAFGPGGDIELQVGAPGRIVLGAPLASGGRQFWNGNVALLSQVQVLAGEGLEVNGTLDADPDATTANLVAQLGNESMPTSSRFSGDIGGQRPPGSAHPPALRSARIPDGEDGPEPDPPPVEHTVELDLGSVTTNFSQGYGTDLLLLRDVGLDSGAAIAFNGNVDAAPGADAALGIDALGTVSFAGDVGAPGAPDLLRGLDVRAGSRVSFLSEDDQQVVVGTDGISLVTEIPGGPNQVPEVATLVRFGGDLTLRSEGGDVLLGDHQKLTATDDLVLEAPAGIVRFTDLNALGAIRVDALDIEVFARDPGEVRLAKGGRLLDRGTDLFADDVEADRGQPGAGGGRRRDPDDLHAYRRSHGAGSPTRGGNRCGPGPGRHRSRGPARDRARPGPARVGARLRHSGARHLADRGSPGAVGVPRRERARGAAGTRRGWWRCWAAIRTSGAAPVPPRSACLRAPRWRHRGPPIWPGG